MLLIGAIAACVLPLGASLAAADPDPGALTLQLDGGTGSLANPLKIVLLLTVLALLPAVVIAMTSFTRIIIVLSMLCHAFGM